MIASAPIRLGLAGLMTSLAAVLAPCSVLAQEYPSRVIRFIAPIPPGGSTDVLARDVAGRLQERLGQPVIVENRPGGAGSLGTAQVARAAPDGYTMLLVNSSHSINPHVYSNLTFDAIKDLVPVVLMAQLRMAVVVNSSSPVKTLQELVALAKSRPGELSYASSGNGGAGHLAGELFLQQTGTRMIHVPYRGSAPAVMDAISGQVPVLVADLPVLGPHLESGKLRALGITANKRSPAAPTVPTMAESGVPGMDISIWVGIMMPAGTPEPIVRRMNREVVEILKEPEMSAKIASRGFELVASTPEEFGKVIKADYDLYGKVVRTANIKAQ